MAERRLIPWATIVLAALLGCGFAAVMGWLLDLNALERQIHKKRKVLDNLATNERITPTPEAIDYLETRQDAIEGQFQIWQELLVAGAQADVTKRDLQLHFQEKYRDAQRMLKKAAETRKITPPELLGFPTELPALDSVPRLLVQLALVREITGHILNEGIAEFGSVRLEDPEFVVDPKDNDALLIRLPVRARFSSSLERLVKILAALERERPIADVRKIRIAKARPGEEDKLDVELWVARYIASDIPKVRDVAGKLTGRVPGAGGSEKQTRKRADDTARAHKL